MEKKEYVQSNTENTHLPFLETWPTNKLWKLTRHVNKFDRLTTPPQNLQNSKRGDKEKWNWAQHLIRFSCTGPEIYLFLRVELFLSVYVRLTHKFYEHGTVMPKKLV